jgi:hypothetical protein
MIAGPWVARAHIAGIAALVIGMILVFAGVRVGPLFLPGVFILDIAFLLFIAAGAAALAAPDPDRGSA